jgi:hypothetical protein
MQRGGTDFHADRVHALVMTLAYGLVVVGGVGGRREVLGVHRGEHRLEDHVARSDALVEVAGAELGVVVTQCLLTPLSRERGGHSHRTPGAVQTLLRLRDPAFSAFVEDLA